MSWRILLTFTVVLGLAAPLTAAETKAISINIGLNSVDPAHYAGWSGDLNACENDANDMAAIATSKGFTCTVLLTAAATRSKVLGELATAATKLSSGDILLLTYSGHGGQIPDTNGDETDLADETWCLYDGEILDDELAAAYSAFAAGVRIFVLSDSCHSGTVTKFREYQRLLEGDSVSAASALRFSASFEDLLSPPAKRTGKPLPSPIRAMPVEIANATYRKNKKSYDDIMGKLPKESASRAAQKATVLLISGCQDNQLSMDGTFNGLFTGKLKYVWDSGRFTGDYREFHEAIVLQMPSYQSPNYYVTGPANPTFEAQTPFTK